MKDNRAIVMIFAQFEPQSGKQITLHYEDPQGTVEVSRIQTLSG